ncbi:MAG: hypothetical protein FIA95_13365 [Gemmatimonadetes bacterium]|nr:hypothetical protein [Gemmatimonadota bacterium]
MNTLLPALAVLQGAEGRSLVDTMVAAIPTDPAALFVLALCVAGAAAVVYYGRKSGKPEGPDTRKGNTP